MEAACGAGAKGFCCGGGEALVLVGRRDSGEGRATLGFKGTGGSDGGGSVLMAAQLRERWV